jgi:apolipoprotein N-acyltransferase
VSGIIAPDGDVVDTADTRTTAVLVHQVGLSDALTPATRIGPWSGRVAMILTALGVLVVLLPYRRRDRRDAGPDEGTSSDLPRPDAEPVTVGR